MRDAKQTEVLLSQQDKYLAKEELPVSHPRNLFCFSIIYSILICQMLIYVFLLNFF